MSREFDDAMGLIILVLAVIVVAGTIGYACYGDVTCGFAHCVKVRP